MVIRVNPQDAIPNQFALDAQAVGNEQRNALMNRQMIDQAQADMGGVMDFLDRRAILNQLAPQQQQLGIQPKQTAQPSQLSEADLQESMTTGLPTEEAEANFLSVAEKTKGQPKEVVDQVLIENIKTVEARGGDSSDSRELLQLPQEQQQLAIGNIANMLQNKAVSRMMARNPEGAKKFLSGIGVTGIDPKASAGGMGAMDKFQLEMLKEQIKAQMGIDKDWQKSEWDIAKAETKDIKKERVLLIVRLKNRRSCFSNDPRWTAASYSY